MLRIVILKRYKMNPYSNIPKSISDKIDRKLHNQPNHPIEIIKRHIYGYFRSDAMKSRGYNFETFDNLDPIVTVEENFDKLLIPKTHPARQKTDTYYVDETHVLRTHTSAHQNSLLAQGHTSFLVTGDVYRKDEVDSKHYPVFHQMEMLTLLPSTYPTDPTGPEKELKDLILGLISYLFPSCNYRFGKDYFPFTDPSFEVEVEYDSGGSEGPEGTEGTEGSGSSGSSGGTGGLGKGRWLEILGCGVVQPKILENNGFHGRKGIAFGIGLERLVMIFCKIPDIRYLWSTHPKFLNQYSAGKLVVFTPYSVLPAITRDISFFIDKDRLALVPDSDNKIETEAMTKNKWIDENDFFGIVRECAGDYMEEVKLIDTFYNQKKQQWSRTYRCTYSANSPEERSPDELFRAANNLQSILREKVVILPGLILR